MSTGQFEYIEINRKALEKLETARILLDNNRFDDAVSRAYYAVFHIISALLLSKGLVYSSHSQVIGSFNREFVKSAIFPSDFSVKVRELFKLRQAGDYSIDPSIDKELAIHSVKDAEIIIRQAAEYLKSTGKL